MTGDLTKNLDPENGDSNSEQIVHSQEDTTVIIKQDESIPAFDDKRGTKRALGSVIGKHYRLEARLGSGGSSIVYLAQDLLLGRKVALKLLLSGAFTSEEDRLRFQREGRAVGSLDHPNIVRVFEFNSTENDEPFLVMEYLDGESLTDLVRTDGKMSVEKSLFFAKQVVSALAYAHSRGLVHRDIKSGNIVITHNSNGETIAKVVDFGLARPDDERTNSLTITGTIVGSPHYMSPEQCKGDKVDARSDIYSFGCVLYECLTGEVPFKGASMLETFRMHLEDQPKPFSRHLKHVQNAAQVEEVVFKCLAKRPEERYQSAEKLEEDLKALELNSRSSALAQAATLYRSIKATSNTSAKRTKRVLAFFAIVALALGAIALKPDLISYPCDQYWSKMDLDAQKFFDAGDYAKAKDEFEKANKFATIAPVTRRPLRLREGYYGLIDIATVENDEESARKLSAGLQEIIQSAPSKEGLQREDPKVLAASFLKNATKLKTESNSKKRQIDAIQLLNTANDAADVMIEEERRVDAEPFLEKTYDMVRDYVPDSEPVVGRTLLNLANIYANSDPYRSMTSLTECDRIMKSVNWPPLAKAHFLSDYGLALILTDQQNDMEMPLNAAIEIYRYQNALTGKSAATAFSRLAQAQVQNFKPDLATTSLEQAETIFKNSEKVTTGEKLRCAITRAEILAARNKNAEANALIDAEILKQEKQFPKNYFDLTEALNSCAKLYARSRADDVLLKKIKHRVERSCAIYERNKNWTFSASLWRWLATYQAQNRRLVDADSSFHNAWRALKHLRSHDYFTEIALLNNYGELLIRRQKYKEADQVLKDCEAVVSKVPFVKEQTKMYLYERRRETSQKLGNMEDFRKYDALIQSSF